jgi:hypothetical protein
MFRAKSIELARARAFVHSPKFLQTAVPPPGAEEGGERGAGTSMQARQASGTAALTRGARVVARS